MKKLAFVLTLLLMMCTAFAIAGNDRVITVKQLPQPAQLFIKSHFHSKVALVKMESKVFGKDYEVIFSNGSKIDFDSKGNWEKIDCKMSAVPSKVIPAMVLRYVKSNYPNERIIKIEKERKGYEVKLSNRMKLEFNNNFQLVDID